MAVGVYTSADGSAPVLDGTAGSLVALLDAVLVNGYGAEAAAGWTKPFTSTNIACFRNHSSGTQFYLRVDDASPNATAGAREAQARGFETMSAHSTGTGPFPTTSQLGTSGIPIRKSRTADSTARPWIAVADNKTLYLFIDSGDFTGYTGFAFGDFFSLGGSDAYRAMIIGRSTQNSDTDDVDRLEQLNANVATSPTLATITLGHYMPRSASGAVQSAIQFGKHGDMMKGAAAPYASFYVLAGNVTYPNLIDGSLMLSQVWLQEDNGNTLSIRGRLRGFWHFLHPAGSDVNDGDTFAGSGPLAGKSFLVIKPGASGHSVYVIETSDTWETN